MKGSGGPPGERALCVLMCYQKTDTQKKPAARKGADMTIDSLKGEFPPPTGSPQGFSPGSLPRKGGVGGGGSCMLALDLQNHVQGSPALPLSSWLTPPL